MDKFSKRLDQIFEQGMPTKAQILDAYNKFVSQSSATDKLIIEKMGELISEYKKLVELCEAPQYHEIMTAKSIQKVVIISIEAELQVLKDKRDEK